MSLVMSESNLVIVGRLAPSFADLFGDAARLSSPPSLYHFKCYLQCVFSITCFRRSLILILDRREYCSSRSTSSPREFTFAPSSATLSFNIRNSADCESKCYISSSSLSIIVAGKTHTYYFYIYICISDCVNVSTV